MAIKLLIGGSPCTHWSIAQRNRETTAEGLGWELFKNYLIAKDKFKPDFFLYENNKSASKAVKEQIAKELGVGTDPFARFTYINSALVSAQNRQRFYVTNFGEIKQPVDRGILLKDILEYGTTERIKSKTVRVGGAKSKYDDKREWDRPNRDRIYTTIELERLQTLPDNYTKAVRNLARRKVIGNSWTAEVIIHLLNHALSDVPRDEEIIVLSFYDGIATGRYCLDKMSFTNVTYYAYEIDKHAITVAMDNYPDIIQCGDAFAVREETWKPPQTRSEWLDDLLGCEL